MSICLSHCGREGDRAPITFYAIYYQSDYAFTGSVQTFTAPVSGWYRCTIIGSWGSNGGRSSNGNAPGAKVTGEVHLTTGQTVYVMIGSGGISNRGGWNGGGKGRDNDNGTGGGGRTDIRLSGDTVGSSNYLIGWNTDILTAGGGGGAKRSSSGRPAMGFVDSNTTGLNGTSHASDIGGAGHYGGKAFYGGVLPIMILLM